MSVDFVASFSWVEQETQGIQKEWGAFVYRVPVDPKTRLRQRREAARRPSIQDLLPEDMETRVVCSWVGQLDGVSGRTVYEEWEWLEVWRFIAVHLALQKSAG